MDLQSEGKNIDLKTLKMLHNKKTGALITVQGKIACILSGAGTDETDAVIEYCNNIGLAFQIRDDILDISGNSAELGKNTGSDASNKKSTFVSLTGAKKSQETVNELTEKAISSIKLLKNSDVLADLAKMMAERRT